MIKKFIIFALSLFMMFSLFACTDNNASDGLTVTVTILPQKAFVEAVVKDLAKVEVLVPSGQSPESYPPTSKQIMNANKSAIYFKIGVPVEETSLVKSITNVKTIDCAEKVRETYPDNEFSDGSRDPHIWLSIKRVKIMVQQIADEMSLIDTNNEQSYQANALEYINELTALNTEVESYFQNKTNKLFLTFHPAYGYLAADYNLKMFALNEEGKEATIEITKSFIDTAKEKNITVIFSQAENDSTQNESVKNEIGASITKLNPLAYDYINNYKDMAQKIAAAMN